MTIETPLTLEGILNRNGEAENAAISRHLKLCRNGAIDMLTFAADQERPHLTSYLERIEQLLSNIGYTEVAP